MEYWLLLFVSSLLVISRSPQPVQAQQPYIRKATTSCNIRDPSTSALGFTCNGGNRSCQAYLTYRSQSPYNTVPSISTLLGANPAELSQLNSVSDNATFRPGDTVLVPVRCSCAGQYYQSNASYVIQAGDTPFLIANNTFQGLSTCQAIDSQRSNLTTYIYTGSRLTVPLRCACPTRNQTVVGTRYLLSYLVTWGQFVLLISAMFGADVGRTLEANQLSETDNTIYPFTTLLVPLQDPPSLSQSLAPPPPPPSSPPPPPPSPSPNGSSNHTWVYALVGVIGGVALTLLIGFIAFCFCFRKRREEVDPPIMSSQSFEAIVKPGNDDKLEDDRSEFLESLSSIAQSLKVYTFKELKSATEDFSLNCWIKGSVYRGTINGDFAAIKKIDGDVSKEIKLLNTVHHHNLIRLSGVCFNKGHWYLVYEYASNGPLSDWLYGSNSSDKFLNWTQRVQVALDVATGLNYLHSYISPPYVYKNLKSSNVLLDGDFRAKITNFDLARAAEGHEGQFALTRHIVGTKGYMSPEYVENGLISTKLDVYAFGVLLLEILTGRSVAELYGEVTTQLKDVFAPVLREEDGKENLSHFMDPTLEGNYPVELVIFVVSLIENCTAKDPSTRPDMDELVQCLSRVMTASRSWEKSMNTAGSESQN